jgi:hypothetical protein
MLFRAAPLMLDGDGALWSVSGPTEAGRLSSAGRSNAGSAGDLIVGKA